MKGVDPSPGPIGKVNIDVKGNDKPNPQAFRKFREAVEAKESIASPAKESQRKIVHDKLKEVGDVWKGINLGEPKKRYAIGELPELRKSIAKDKSVSSQPPQSSEIAGQKSKVPWGPLTDSRSWPLNNTVPQKPKAARQRDDSEPQNAKDTVDLKTFQNDAFGAYSKALAEGKFTVIQFGSGYCGFCKNLIKKLGDPALAKYANGVVVSDTDGDVDPGARQLEIALGVVRYPTLVVLKTNSKNIHVAGRIEGEVSVSEIDRIFQEAMKEPIGK